MFTLPGLKCWILWAMLSVHLVSLCFFVFLYFCCFNETETIKTPSERVASPVSHPHHQHRKSLQLCFVQESLTVSDCWLKSADLSGRSCCLRRIINPHINPHTSEIEGTLKSDWLSFVNSCHVKKDELHHPSGNKPERWLDHAYQGSWDGLTLQRPKPSRPEEVTQPESECHSLASYVKTYLTKQTSPIWICQLFAQRGPKSNQIWQISQSQSCQNTAVSAFTQPSLPTLGQDSADIQLSLSRVCQCSAESLLTLSRDSGHSVESLLTFSWICQN